MNATLSTSRFFVKGNASEEIKDRYIYSTDVQFKVFASLWAIATLFHFANKGTFTEHLNEFALTASAIFVLFRPGSLQRFFIFIFFQLYDSLISIPSISNHWIFTAIVNITFIYAFFFTAYKEKSFSVDKNKLFQTFAPIAKIELLILYFFVVFHKLNSGFFNTSVSCATEFYLSQNAYGLLPNTKEMLLANAFLTIGVEALIPILLCFRRTRNVGILIGVLFHCIIAYNPINGFYDFSSMIFAMYVLFTDKAFNHQVISVFNKVHNSFRYYSRRLFGFSYGKLLLLGGLLLAAFVLLHVLNNRLPDYMRHLIWTSFSFAFIFILVVSILKRGKQEEEHRRSFAIAHWSFLLFPVILFINGMCPYIGLKTEYSFAMFSNLRTEGGVSNHYIMPASAQIFGFQKDLVEVLSSSEPEIHSMANTNKLYVFQTLQSRVQRYKPESLVYIRDGKQITFNYAEAPKTDALKQPIPIYQKFFRFRKIDKIGEQTCDH